MRRDSLLGGEQMPEDAHPNLDKSSRDLLHYLTFPMALNYQRNSYALWKAATATHSDEETKFVFNPTEYKSRGESELRRCLLKYRVALQPNKHIARGCDFQKLCVNSLREICVIYLNNAISHHNKFWTLYKSNINRNSRT